MSGHPSFASRLRLPVLAAPMFLASGPDLVVACCKAGIVGCFPALNQRSSVDFARWLDEIEGRLAENDSPYGVNLIVHRTNPRVSADLEHVVGHRVPLVITSLGAVPDVVAAVHSYGGQVFHDVINARHAEKAIAAGVDGLVLVCAGAGGHSGALSPFALIPEVRAMFGGTIVLAGAISGGAQIAAAQVMGADLVYMGTRFLATRESLLSDAYKAMVVEAKAADIVYTPAITGIPASFLRQSLASAGLEPDNLAQVNLAEMKKQGAIQAQAWRDIWSAGQGVGSITEVLPVSELAARLKSEYRLALETASRLLTRAAGSA